MFSETDRDNLGWLWQGYLREKAKWVVLIFVLIISQGFVYQQFLRLTEDGLRVIFDNGNIRDLVIVCLTVFGVISYRGVMSYVVPRMSAWVAADAIKKLRGDLINHLMSLDLSYFERTPPGETILRLSQQVESLGSFLGQGVVRAGRDFFTVIIVAGYLFWRQPILSTAAAVVFPLIIIAMQLVARRIKTAQIDNQQAMKDYVSGLEETVSGMRTVKIAGQEHVERDRLQTITEFLRDRTVRVQSSNALIAPFVDFAAAIVYAVVIGGGGYMVLSPDFDVDGAGIIAFLIGLVLVFDPGRRFAQFVVGLQSNFVLLDIVRGLFRETPTIVDSTNATEDFDPAGTIRFDAVSFGYTTDQPLFQDLTLDFPGGKTTAIVGPTGSGKTTLLSLLGRLYDPASGTISIGERPLCDIRIRALRAAFSVVAQDIVIFNNSIWDNVRYVRPDATDDEIWAAADAAELSDLIRQRGDDPVGPKGAQLSGGQRQRIGIARAFLRNAPIVLLDEATSALDQATEEKVKVALGRLAKEKTTIVVAHRLSSITHADKIYVLESGSVAESGTHDTLLSKNGLYAHLFNAQKAGYADKNK